MLTVWHVLFRIPEYLNLIPCILKNIELSLVATETYQKNSISIMEYKVSYLYISKQIIFVTYAFGLFDIHRNNFFLGNLKDSLRMCIK